MIKIQETELFAKGYNSATEAVKNGEDPVELLNQCRSSLTNDDFDKDWKQALNAIKNK